MKLLLPLEKVELQNFKDTWKGGGEVVAQEAKVEVEVEVELPPSGGRRNYRKKLAVAQSKYALTRT